MKISYRTNKIDTSAKTYHLHKQNNANKKLSKFLKNKHKRGRQKPTDASLIERRVSFYLQKH